MIRSMTAFARQEIAAEWGTLTLEIRSVNHRYLETFIRLPDELRSLEALCRERIQQHLQRGKVDCQVRYQPLTGEAQRLHVNFPVLTQLAEACEQINAVFKNPRPVSPIEVLRWPEVLQVPQVDPAVLQTALQQLLEQALQAMLDMRSREGAKLKQLLVQRLDAIAAIVTQVRNIFPEVKQLQREKLQARLQEIQAQVDADRFEQEILFLLQKTDIDEELDRLTSHCGEIKHVLQQTEPVGRRLDFLMQELNREANTLGSKSVDIRTSNASIDLKVLIEQMREQVQNIE